MDNHIFRGAALGFNRQDVMEYIERTQKQAEENAARLEAQAEDLRKSGEESRQALEDLTGEKEALARQLEDMTQSCEQAKSNWESQAKAREALRQDLKERDNTIRELTEENQRLFYQVQELEGRLDSQRREKERSS